MNKPVQLISALLIGLICILSPTTTHADNTEQKVAILEKQIAELQKQIEVLQKQVTELRERIAAREPLPIQNQENTGDWTIRENWLALERGLTKMQVIELLGEPEIVQVVPYGHNWFYHSGYITFDHMGKVERWSKPL